MSQEKVVTEELENIRAEAENPVQEDAPAMDPPAETTPSAEEQQKEVHVVKAEEIETTGEPVEESQKIESTEEPMNIESPEKIDQVEPPDEGDKPSRSLTKKIVVKQPIVDKVVVEKAAKQDDSKEEVDKEEEDKDEDEEMEQKLKKEEDKTKIKEEEIFNDKLSLLDSLYESQSEEEDIEPAAVEEPVEETYLKDFLASFGSVPSLSSLSAVSIVSKMPSVTSTQTISVTDAGKFVDPISGEIITEPRVVSQHKIATKAEDKKPPEEEEYSEESEQFVLPEEFDYEKEEARLTLVDDALVTFLHLEDKEPVVQVDQPIDTEALLLQRTQKYIKDSTAHFLRSLINAAVNAAEYVDPRAELRENLDKKKILVHIRTKLRQLQVQRKEQRFLDRKVAAYFQRKKAFRFITQHDQSREVEEIKKLHTVLENLDTLMGKETYLKNIAYEKLSKMREEMEEKRTMFTEAVQEFEDMVHNAFRRGGFSQLKTHVDIQLRTMAKTREEISKIRKELILRQHTWATVTEKLEACEDLSEGLKLKDFDQLLMAVDGLDKNNEELSGDLSKSRKRCYEDLHKSCHTSQALNMLRHQAELDEEALEILHLKRLDLREVLFEEKVFHTKLNKELSALSFQGGLVDKPALMIDFDESSEKLDIVRKRVLGLRWKLTYLTEKVRVLEAKLNKH